MKKSSILSLVLGVLFTASSWAGMQNIKCIWFRIPGEAANTSWLKTIAKPTPDKPKSMKNAIYFDEQKITFINNNGVVREFISEGSGTSTIQREKDENPRIWKIPNPKATPKDENDFVATFQIFKKGIVLTFKAGSDLDGSLYFRLKE